MYYNGLSNGPLEGINNKIKVIKRISYGYRPFSNFKSKVLFVFSMFTLSETNKIVYNILCKQKSQEKLKKRHRKKRLLGVK